MKVGPLIQPVEGRLNLKLKARLVGMSVTLMPGYPRGLIEFGARAQQ